MHVIPQKFYVDLKGITVPIFSSVEEVFFPHVEDEQWKNCSTDCSEKVRPENFGETKSVSNVVNYPVVSKKKDLKMAAEPLIFSDRINDREGNRLDLGEQDQRGNIGGGVLSASDKWGFDKYQFNGSGMGAGLGEMDNKHGGSDSFSGALPTIVHGALLGGAVIGVEGNVGKENLGLSCEEMVHVPILSNDQILDQSEKENELTGDVCVEIIKNFDRLQNFRQIRKKKSGTIPRFYSSGFKKILSVKRCLRKKKKVKSKESSSESNAMFDDGRSSGGDG